MRILILINRNKTQLLKLVAFNKLIKSAKTKILLLNKETNKIKDINGSINEKFDFIKSVYKKKQEFNFEKDNFFEMEIKPYINTTYSYYNTNISEILPEYLEKEYNNQITKNENIVLEYNIIKRR